MSMITMTGYHGTTLSNADKILREKEFHFSKDDDEWLGKGIYFFAYKRDAEDWIRLKRFTGKPTGLLSAELRFDEEQRFDLDDPDALDRINFFAEEMFKKNPRFIHAEMSRHQKWCVVCNIFKDAFPQYVVMTYTFQWPGRSGTLYKRNQRQICVTDHSVIHDIKKV